MSQFDRLDRTVRAWPTRRAMLLSVLAGAGLCALPAMAQQAVLRIAAVVNEEIISLYDLDSRLRLIMLNSGLQPTQENFRRLAPDILRQLIDERLRVQEATKTGVSVSDNDVTAEMDGIGARNNIGPGQIDGFLQQRGIDPATLRAQIKANIAWARLVNRRLRRDSEIGEDEIDLELERLRQSLDKPQNRVFEIFLPVDNIEREGDIRRGAESLVAQLRAGAPFSEVARTFSQSSTARVGGDLGWQPSGALPFEVEEVLDRLQPGQVSDPIRTMTGFAIIRLADRRLIQAVDPGLARLELVQVSGTGDGAAAALETLRGQSNDCDALEVGAEQIPGLSAVRVEEVLLRDLPQEVRDAVMTLKAGSISPTIALPDRQVMLGICSRQDPPTPLPSRDEIRDRLQRERLDLLARRYLRDLRQAAFIDIRM